MRREEVVDRATEEPGELPRARNGDRRVPLRGDVADIGLRHADRFSDGHLGDTREGDRGGDKAGWRRGTKNGELCLGEHPGTIRDEGSGAVVSAAGESRRSESSYWTTRPPKSPKTVESRWVFAEVSRSRDRERVTNRGTDQEQIS